mgnify:CR=1 FL=1
MFREDRLQQTIAEEVNFAGIGLHSGNEVNATFKPAQADTGVVFRRVDLASEPEIKADPVSVTSTKRCTSIGRDNVNVHTVEHILASLWALKIDNIIVELDSEETPVADGSVRPFMETLSAVGTEKLDRKSRVWLPGKPLWVEKENMSIVILPYDGYKVSYTLDFEHPVVGTQFFQYEINEESFADEIAGARTFGFEREVKALHKKGLALGGSLDNAVLIGDDSYVNPLRYPDELVRHKVLDVIGDMALNGFIEGHIICIRSGHSLHVELAKKIYQNIKQE